MHIPVRSLIRATPQPPETPQHKTPLSRGNATPLPHSFSSSSPSSSPRYCISLHRLPSRSAYRAAWPLAACHPLSARYGAAAKGRERQSRIGKQSRSTSPLILLRAPQPRSLVPSPERKEPQLVAYSAFITNSMKWSLGDKLRAGTPPFFFPICTRCTRCEFQTT